jgi:hypothetical protein
MSVELQSLRLSTSILGLSAKSTGLTYRCQKDDMHVYTDGTGDLQGRTFIEYDTRALANTNEDINLTTALDTYGVAAALTKLSFIWIKYEAGTAGSYLTIKQAASNGVTNIFVAAGDGVKLAVGEERLFAFTVGRTVVASTGDLLNVVSTVADATYSFIAFGS